MRYFIPIAKTYTRVRPFDLGTAVFIAILTLSAITAVDIIFHDTLILPSYQCDNPSFKDSDYCKAINQVTTINIDIADLKLHSEVTGRQHYWIVLNVLIGVLALVPAGIRARLGSFKAAALWAFTIGILPVSGFEDLLYFQSRGLPIPSELPWLNANPYIALFANGHTVTATTLYISMAATMLLLAVVWAIALRKRY